MNYILDTHYALWTLFEPEKISDNIIKILEDDNHKKYVSQITFWEISLKYSIGKLEFEETNPNEIYEKIVESGFNILEINSQVFTAYFQLPRKEKHKDPFDRILIWQAINKDFTLITKDKMISQYIDNGLKIEFGT